MKVLYFSILFHYFDNNKICEKLQQQKVQLKMLYYHFTMLQKKRAHSLKVHSAFDNRSAEYRGNCKIIVPFVHMDVCTNRKCNCKALIKNVDPLQQQ